MVHVAISSDPLKLVIPIITIGSYAEFLVISTHVLNFTQWPILDLISMRKVPYATYASK